MYWDNTWSLIVCISEEIFKSNCVILASRLFNIYVDQVLAIPHILVKNNLLYCAAAQYSVQIQ